MEFVACCRDRSGAVDNRRADPLKVCDDLFAVLCCRATEAWHDHIKVIYRLPVICDAIRMCHRHGGKNRRGLRFLRVCPALMAVSLSLSVAWFRGPRERIPIFIVLSRDITSRHCAISVTVKARRQAAPTVLLILSNVSVPPLLDSDVRLEVLIHVS